jgi:hypothetical protein
MHRDAEEKACERELPDCRQTVAEIRAAVFGNGHPERSLLVRMDRVESRLAAIQKLSFATLCGVGTLLMKVLGAWFERMLGG